MKVIGAGLGRTGTKSLQTALILLGLDPCYHMTEVVEKGGHHTDFWQAVCDNKGKDADWAGFLKDYQAGVDMPVSVFYKELADAFPEAKLILTVREPEAWFKSVNSTIMKIHTDWSTDFLCLLIPRMAKFHRMAKTMWGLFGPWEHDNAISAFNAHNLEVKSTIPAERLLVFDVKQGWEPLCKFLCVPVPDVPFPHVNEQASMERIVKITRVLATTILATSAAAVSVAAYFAQTYYF